MSCCRRSSIAGSSAGAGSPRDPVETRTGDTPANRRARQRVLPPDILLTTPESLALLIAYPRPENVRGSGVCGRRRAARARGRQARPAAGARARPARAVRAGHPLRRSVGHGEPARRAARLPRAGRPPRPADPRRPGPRARRVDPLGRGPPAVGRPLRHLRRAVAVRDHQAGRHHARVRQHPRPGGDHLPGIVADQRRPSADRAPPRLARGRAAAQGRGGDGPRRAEGGGLHLLALPRGPDRRAQRRRASCNGSDGRTTASTSPRARSWCRANRFEVLECIAALDAIREHTLDGAPLHPGGLDVLAQHLVGTTHSASTSASGA